MISLKNHPTVPHMKLVGTKIRKVRELRDFTQEFMASQLGKSQTAYSKLERGEVDVSFSNLTRIAEILEIDVMQLLTFDGSSFIANKETSSASTTAKEVSNVMVQLGLSDRERELYERKIQSMQDEILFLRSLVRDKNC